MSSAGPAVSGGTSKSASAGTSAGAAGRAGAGSSAPAAAGSAPGSSGSSTALGQAVAPAQPKVVMTGDVNLTVGRGALQFSFDRISGLATGGGGFVASSSMAGGGSTPSARLVLRIANAQVQAVLASLRALGTVTSEQLQGTDVTGQVVNVDAQLTTLQAEAQAVQTLLARATSIGDILQIQNQLFGLQTQIQQLAGQQGTLADQTTYATLSVEVVAPVGAPAPVRPSRPTVWSRAWHAATENTAAVGRAVVLTVGWVAPVLVLAAVVGIPLEARRRRRGGRPWRRSAPNA